MKKVLILLLVTVFAFSCKEEKKVEKPIENEKTEMQKNLSKYVTVKLTSDVSKLTENEQKMLPILIEAADIMNELFWYESYGDKDELLNSIEDEDTKKFANINYGPWDSLNGNSPFVEGVGEKPNGANYYPADMTKEEYKNSTAPTINHFYEKLLLLKDQMNTNSGKKIAEERHSYMEGFLKQFYDEWNGIK